MIHIPGMETYLHGEMVLARFIRMDEQEERWRLMAAESVTRWHLRKLEAPGGMVIGNRYFEFARPVVVCIEPDESWDTWHAYKMRVPRILWVEYEERWSDGYGAPPERYWVSTDPSMTVQ